jgi:PAS domain S-box-containing protein
MKTDTASDSEARQNEIASLVQTLRETEQRLQELTGGQVDGVPHPGGPLGMLHEAQEKLHESADRFRGLFSASAIGIAISTPHGSYLRANAAYCRMLGYTEDELRALNFATLTHPDDLGLNLHLRDDLLAGRRQSFSMEKRYVTKSGDVVWTRHDVSATHGSGGEITTLMVIAEDITERKLAEDALRRSEERLRLITHLVPHGIFAKDAVGRYIFANPAMAELCGLPLADILGKTDFDLVADRAQAEACQADDRAVIESASRMVVSEAPRTDLSGRARMLHTIKVPFNLAETGERAVLGVCMDITERKRTEARFRRLIDSNVQGVMFWNMNGDVVQANDAFLRLVGYSRDDLAAGRINWAALTPPEHAHRDRRATQQIAETGVCEPYEKEYIRKDGSRVPILVGGTMFEGSDEEGVCFVLDLTERKKLEQQFLRAQRLESIGTLAGGIAHDLNNILTPILMSIEFLKSLMEDAEGLELLETIEMSAHRGAGIVQQVLSFARGVEGQRTKIQPEVLLNDLAKIVRDTFPKNILLRLEVPGDVWTFSGDPTQVHQILLNLCVNARDAMPEGGTLTISVQNCSLDEQYAATNIQAKPGRYVNFKVSDSGTGIAPDIIDKIFDPFFTTKELDKGTGLGLSTVMAIVRSHDGIVNVYSEPGNGTTFNVYLWAMEEVTETEPEPAQQIAVTPGNGETLLLVDDDPFILAVTSRALQTSGYRVLTARDGAEGVAVYAQRKNDIALVFTDMMMPIMDGKGLVRVLRHIDPAVRIVGTSGLPLSGNGSGFAEAGIRHFLMKPYTAEALLKAIRAALDEPQATDAP